MSEELQQRTMVEVMAAAEEVIGQAGATIVGGHSSMGAEFAIGFTVTGLLDRAPITLNGAQPGDAVILTKPIGSGVILAADMAGQARGWDVAAMLDGMCQPQGDAADILSMATAMTDVTGFGLLGHLWGICENSSVSAQINQSTIPFLRGAEELSRNGHRSSIFYGNVAAVGNLKGVPRDLLYDPQTAGGLLATVPHIEANAVVERLLLAGYAQACVIGTIAAGAAEITVS